jgi:hypothetical protein
MQQSSFEKLIVTQLVMLFPVFNETHYRVQKSPPLVCMLSQMNPVHRLPFHFSKIHLIFFPIFAYVFQAVSSLLIFLHIFHTFLIPPIYAISTSHIIDLNIKIQQ